MPRVIFVCLLLLSLQCSPQRTVPSIANAHSHNDYEQSSPFWAAWKQGFGSIEADIYLHEGQLIVAHDRKQLSRRWTLDSLYLLPLKKCIAENQGSVYADSGRQLQLMIDIKTESVPALTKLVEELKQFPMLTNCRSLLIVISGSRPDPSSFHDWPEWIKFDGVFQREYTDRALQKIEMFSDNFASHSGWKGEGEMSQKDQEVISALVRKAHQLGKKIRFWNAPDNAAVWNTFLDLGIDYINTDKIDELGDFLKEGKKTH